MEASRTDASMLTSSITSAPVRRARRGDPSLRDRVEAPGDALQEAWEILYDGGGVAAGSRGAEWFLDNHHVVRRATAEVRRSLGRTFELRLLRDVDTGIPRVHSLAAMLVAADFGHVDDVLLAVSLRQVQAESPLSTAELWALPLALRVALIEALSEAMAVLLERRDRAHSDRMVANCIRSLRTLERLDWREMFERNSPVEQILRGDPAGVYPRMDFETRDSYRRQVEAIAWSAGRSEAEVAREVLSQCGARGHVGDVLVGAKQRAFEEALGYGPPLLRRFRRAIRRFPTAVYLTMVLGFTLAVEVGLAATLGPGPGTLLAILLALIPASAVGVGLANLAATNLLPPRTLPKLDLENGIEPEERTIVVVPCLLSSAAEVDSLLAQIEVHYLANPEPELRFALLSDFTDAQKPQMPGDESLLVQASAGIDSLNRRHAGATFLLLHRRRDYNGSEDCFMGWERKRGKLAELGALLLGRPRPGAWTFAGPTVALEGVRYVITLDADTRLNRGGAAHLIGTLAHPLNRARFDPETGRVISGYTILQPRVEVTPTSSTATPFARVFAGIRGLDPYTRAVSDAYQDLFGEGSFVGKGIYDVEAFHRSVHGRVPENSLLSHDLLEGLHGRAALVSDIVVFEDYPGNYLAWAKRQHRWIRGDWQLLPWLVGDGRLSLIGRWKIVDNLRRSLEPPALLLLLVAGWTVLPGGPFLWTVLAVLARFAPVAPGLVLEAIRRARPGLRTPPSAPQITRKVADTALRIGVELALIPHLALLSVDAIARTLVRVGVTRRRLLEWTTAAATGRLVAQRSMWRVAAELAVAPVCGAVALIGLWGDRGAWLAASPFALAWLGAPALAVVLSRPSLKYVSPPDKDEKRRLRLLARRTWMFFDTQVGPEHHWLPPDNVQESPGPKVAPRTSPTNVGLSLLSTIAAWDLGYLDATHAVLRLRNTLDTLDQLEKYRGHLYNWYDTQRLLALEPRYVSTVDSGNLAASLIAMRQALSEFLTEQPLRKARWRGLTDSLGVLEQAACKLGDDTELLRMIRRLAVCAATPPDGARRSNELITELRTTARTEGNRLLMQIVSERPDIDGALLAELRLGIGHLHDDLRDLHRELQIACPWVGIAHPNAPHTIAVSSVLTHLDGIRSIHDTPGNTAEARRLLDALDASLPDSSAWRPWSARVRSALDGAALSAENLRQGIARIDGQAAALVDRMDFAFLYDTERHLLRIGFDASHDRPDPNHYDLLASEARITSIVSMAKGDIPESHWMYLGRRLGQPGGLTTLLSWSGSMFEYRMAPLLLHEPPETLLGQSSRAAVAEQITWGRRNDVPWGFSESGYHTFDADENYQYRAFGAPGLGFMRGLGDDLVVAPYATVLALGVAPEAALENLDRLERVGAVGTYGLFEAIDYTPSRVPGGQPFAMVRSWMAHHQGMALLALANRLFDDVFVRRFHRDRTIQTVDLLLQESAPRRVALEPRRPAEMPTHERVATVDLPPWEVSERPGLPERYALSNGRLTSVIGRGGWLEWEGLALTRRGVGLRLWMDQDGKRSWLEDAKRVFHGHLSERLAWMNGVAFRERVVVSGDVDAEVRLFTLANESDRPVTVTLGSYEEVVVGPGREDQRHAAFSKLFVESEASGGALIFHRRKREDSAPDVWMLRMFVQRGSRIQSTHFETDRVAFLGRHASRRDHPLVGEGTVGTVLDPVAALSAELILAPHEPVQLAQVTVAGRSREEVLSLAEAFRSFPWIEWTLDVAHERAELEVANLRMAPEELPTAQALLSRVLCPWHPSRAPADLLSRNRLGQSALWRFSISGDLPIVVFRLSSPEDVSMLRQALRAWAFWRDRGIGFDLVILGEQGATYDAVLDDRIYRQIAEVGATPWIRRPGGITPLSADQLSHVDLDAVLSSARIILRGDGGPIEHQLKPPISMRAELPPLVPTRESPPTEAPFEFDEVHEPRNRWGGFACNGDYLIQLEPGMCTPAPWCNVVANAQGFGFVMTESGGGYTWAGNAGENRLTPWSGDAVLDCPGESLYLRDEETTEIWSPTPMPAPAGRYQIRHAPGATTFTHRSHGLDQELVVTCAPEDPVKIMRLQVVDRTNRPRRVTVTLAVEWVLGASRLRDTEHVIPEFDADHQVFLARNPWSPAFPEAVAFAAASHRLHGMTGDRVEFYGSPPDRERPPGLVRIGLSSTVEAGRDPGAMLQVHLDVPAMGRAEVVFLLGQGADRDQAMALVERYRPAEASHAAARGTTAFWEDRLGSLQVRTPDRGLDLLVNRWLMYQCLSSRVLGRTGFYQSSGAYGFRDQLQDVTSLSFADPGRWREHLLRAASKQFPDGDVLHWWHPPGGAGIRSRCSDDLLWLPWATAAYVEATGDRAVLDEQVPWLAGPLLGAEELERYGTWEPSQQSASLYEHCLAAIDRGWQLGDHDLPLMGSGDWNDGMSRVGAGGRGQSVWLAWFCVAVARAFVPICERIGESSAALALQARADRLAEAVEREGWDGGWYRRALFDDGTPLGTRDAEECQIDAIAQAWAVLSGAGDVSRAETALDAVEEHLVREGDGLVALLTPPFDRSEPDPGYIRGYPPGVRENGGQYTHAALWVLWAMLKSGRVDRSVELFDRITCLWHGGIHTQRYRVEPYVFAADIYGASPHTGRGGWTWYTGAAAWGWRFAVEGVLGIRLVDGALSVTPAMPSSWPGFEATIRRGETSWTIRAQRGPHPMVEVDGVEVVGPIPLVSDGQPHVVRVVV